MAFKVADIVIASVNSTAISCIQFDDDNHDDDGDAVGAASAGTVADTAEAAEQVLRLFPDVADHVVAGIVAVFVVTAETEAAPSTAHP